MLVYDQFFIAGVIDAIDKTPHEDASEDAQEWFANIYSMAKSYLTEIMNDSDNSELDNCDNYFRNTMQGESLACYIFHLAGDELFSHPLTDKLMGLVAEREQSVEPPYRPWGGKKTSEITIP